jgi:hypothetical protein
MYVYEMNIYIYIYIMMNECSHFLVGRKQSKAASQASLL